MGFFYLLEFDFAFKSFLISSVVELGEKPQLPIKFLAVY